MQQLTPKKKLTQKTNNNKPMVGASLRDRSAFQAWQVMHVPSITSMFELPAAAIGGTPSSACPGDGIANRYYRRRGVTVGFQTPRPLPLPLRSLPYF